MEISEALALKHGDIVYFNNNGKLEEWFVYGKPVKFPSPSWKFNVTVRKGLNHIGHITFNTLRYFSLTKENN